MHSSNHRFVTQMDDGTKQIAARLQGIFCCLQGRLSAMPLQDFELLLPIGLFLIIFWALKVVEGIYSGTCFYCIMYITLLEGWLCLSRTSLAFRLMPQSNAILDCTPVAAAGHVIPQNYVPISVSQFMDDLSVEEDVLCNHTDYVRISLRTLWW